MNSLSSISLLSFDEDEAETLSEWARGLDWVHWLMDSVRQRVPHLAFVSPGGTRGEISEAWDRFAETVWPEIVGPVLAEAWRAAGEGRVEALIACDEKLNSALVSPAREASVEAGRRLLRTTRGARYQGVLGKYRVRVDEGDLEPHAAVVWAVTGGFFQLGMASVIAEYLHLEWDTATRHLSDRHGPLGKHGIAGLTSRMVHETSVGLRIQPRKNAGH